MNNKKSLIEIAYDLLGKKKNPYDFYKLWEEVRQIAGLESEEAMNKIAGFYAQLILDGRFVTIGENKWDLRKRHTFEQVHIDMNDIYAEEDEVIDEDLEDEAEIEEEVGNDEDKVISEDEVVEDEKSIDFENEEEEY